MANANNKDHYENNGATRLVSIDSLRTERGWETLASRRHKHKLLLFFKTKSELTPDNLSSLFPPSVAANCVQFAECKKH